MRLVIISGLIGSGKSTISKLLKRKGFHYLNADKIAKDIILSNEKVQNKLIKSFGSNVVFKNNVSIIKLRRKLISSKSNKKIIEDIVHPYFFRYINPLINRLKEHNIVLELPLLDTCKNISHSYKIITVDCSLKNRLRRVIKKRGITRSDFLHINKMQASRSFYLDNADYILPNNDTMSVLNKKFEKLYRNNLMSK